MSQKLERTSVSLKAKTPVELEPGITLPVGQHPAVRKRIGLPTLGGISWTNPEYLMTFSGEQLARMGGKVPDLISYEIDVTKFVREGLLTLS